MRFLGNVIWLVLGGFWLAIEWLLVALVLTVLVVTIPFARQSVKIAHLALWPMGRHAVHDPTATPLGAIGQILWIVLAGWWLALSHLVAGVVLCLTIIGIPFGVQSFKLAGLALAPFGKRIVSRADMQHGLAAAG